MEKRYFTITKKEEGLTLGQFLKLHYPSCSMRLIKRAVEKGACEIQGSSQKFFSFHLKASLKLVVYPHFFKQEVKKTLVFDPDDLLYEDDDLFIYNKPSGLVSDRLALKQFFPGNLELVHRLDKETSGALLLAKSKTVLEALIQQFRNFDIYKHYVAIVDGVVKKDSGVIENYLEEKKRLNNSIKMGVTSNVSRGQYACTKWRVLKRFKDYTELLCEPKTGRTHQLRVHLSQIGHPILGDLHYAERFKSHFRPVRMLLHSKTLSFIHPKTKIRQWVTATVPQEFSR